MTDDQINELHIIQRCFSAVSNLLSPETDLHAVDRDDLSLLVSYLSNRLEKTMEGR
ncbi:hypothetical protein [Methylicorpusculum sp.]|uniref:hypothetical protein n=1 Tax=Methylicorpusculum sp. TaxID=2713644 RepID=UPI002ABC8FA4|nr:hypothetical protein [Methylicorpusculum sp.]MDZ4153746.1 hypothetical protein [Methylicorpusculum sp.]